MRWFLVSLAIAGCASAGPGNSIVGGLSDGGGLPELDAATIDAPVGQLTLSQTASTAIKGENSFACIATVTNETPPNSYYRVFTLADHGVTATFHITEVTFGIEDAAAAGGVQPATIRLGTYGGAPGETTLDLAQVRALGAVDIQIADTSGTRMTVPITADVAPASHLVVELEIPSNDLVKNRFLIGSNDGSERRPGYLMSAPCEVTRPTAFRSLSNPAREVDILMTVTGTM